MQVRCAEEGNEAGVGQAVQAGASVDWVEREGWAALHYAAASGNSGVVQLLLNYSADPNVRSMAPGEEGKRVKVWDFRSAERKRSCLFTYSLFE